jgi:hypothetical protein
MCRLWGEGLQGSRQVCAGLVQGPGVQVLTPCHGRRSPDAPLGLHGAEGPVWLLHEPPWRPQRASYTTPCTTSGGDAARRGRCGRFARWYGAAVCARRRLGKRRRAAETRGFNGPSKSSKNGRGGPIRTGDPLLPKQMRYQAAPRPEVRHLAPVRRLDQPQQRETGNHGGREQTFHACGGRDEAWLADGGVPGLRDKCVGRGRS